jgi:hypothetical protein
MLTAEFYNARAADCRAEAAGSDLVNVRNRCLNAASVWDEMADRVQMTQAYRVEDAARRTSEGRRGYE